MYLLPSGSAAMVTGLAPGNAAPPSRLQSASLPASQHPPASAPRRGRPPGKGKPSRTRARHPSSSESSESSASSSSDGNSSDADSDAVSHSRRHDRHDSAQAEAAFMSALTKFWEAQGEAGQKLLRKFRHLDALRLYSGMPTVNAYLLWVAVTAVGGYETVCPHLACR